MSWQATIVMEPSLLEVRRTTQALMGAIEDIGTETSRCELELAFVEACTNSAKHGSKGGGRRDIRVTLQIEDAFVEIAIEDGGEEFDPFEEERKIDLEDLASLPCGGYGLGLIRKICDSVDYTHNAFGNKLILRKRLTPASTERMAVRSA